MRKATTMFHRNQVFIVCFVLCCSQVLAHAVSKQHTSQHDDLARREEFGNDHVVPLKTSPRQEIPGPGGKIHFPGEPMSPRIDTVVPCNDATVCETVTSYPKDLIKNAIRARKHEFSHLDKVDASIEVGQRFGPSSDYETLCETVEDVIFPKAAKNLKNEWLYVVNIDGLKEDDETFKQGFRIERCRTENTTCRYMEHADSGGYETVCKQKYITRPALGMKNNELVEEQIQLPSSCCCHIRFRGNVGSRFSPKE